MRQCLCAKFALRTRTRTNKPLPWSWCSYDCIKPQRVMSALTLTLLTASICCCMTEKPPPNIIIMLMDDVSYFHFLFFLSLCVLYWFYFFKPAAQLSEWLNKTGAVSFSLFVDLVVLTSGERLALVFTNPLLFRWVGGTWECLASPQRKPPTWMPWLLRGCCFPTSTLPTRSVPHVSQHTVFTGFYNKHLPWSLFEQ